MNCKGCAHCVLVSKIDEPYLKASFHYCDIHIEYDIIGQAYKWCKGRDYEEKKEQETAEANPLYQRRNYTFGTGIIPKTNIRKRLKK